MAIIRGYSLESDEVRDLFKKENIVASDWYAERLENKQSIDIDLMLRKIENLEVFIANPINESVIEEFQYKAKLQAAKDTLKYYQSDSYLESLKGTIGAAAIAL